MKRKIFHLTLVALLVLLLGVAVAATQGQRDAQDAVRPGSRRAVSTGFTYQGQLKKDGSPVNGPCDLVFRLYDAAELGAQVGSAISRTVPISGELFTVGLDFGPAAFAGDARWLGI